MVAHSLWERGAAGSNPATPTQAECRTSSLVLPRPRRGRRVAKRPDYPDQVR